MAELQIRKCVTEATGALGHGLSANVMVYGGPARTVDTAQRWWPVCTTYGLAEPTPYLCR